MSFTGFIVEINVCKSLELNWLHANLPPHISCFSAQNIYTPNKMHKERLVWAWTSKMCFFFCFVSFFTSCKSLLELWDADLWSGQPSWWLQRTQHSGWYLFQTLPQVCWDLFSVKRMCVLYTRLWSSGLYHCAYQQNKHLHLLKLLQLLWGFFFNQVLTEAQAWNTTTNYLGVLNYLVAGFVLVRKTWIRINQPGQCENRSH